MQGLTAYQFSTKNDTKNLLFSTLRPQKLSIMRIWVGYEELKVNLLCSSLAHLCWMITVQQNSQGEAFCIVYFHSNSFAYVQSKKVTILKYVIQTTSSTRCGFPMHHSEVPSACIFLGKLLTFNNFTKVLITSLSKRKILHENFTHVFTYMHLYEITSY